MAEEQDGSVVWDLADDGGRMRSFEEWLFRPRFSILNLIALIAGVVAGNLL